MAIQGVVLHFDCARAAATRMRCAKSRTCAAPALNEQTDKVRGCLLAGAVGDALGAPVEFLSRLAILAKFGPGGIRDFAGIYGRLGAVTDDTQMSLFTAEGLIRACLGNSPLDRTAIVDEVTAAYLRWYHTQTNTMPARQSDPPHSSWLLSHRELYSLRAPGSTCMSALRILQQTRKAWQNDSKGCGGVMRAAPVGILCAGLCMLSETAMDWGIATAAITHGHASGQLSAGAFAMLVTDLLRGLPLDVAAEHVIQQLLKYRGGNETRDALQKALQLSRAKPNSADALSELGGGVDRRGVYCHSRVLRHEHIRSFVGANTCSQSRWRQ